MDFTFALARTQVSVFDVESHGVHAHGHGVSHVAVRRLAVLLRLPTSRNRRFRLLSRRSAPDPRRCDLVRFQRRTCTSFLRHDLRRMANFAFVTRSVAVEKHIKEQQQQQQEMEKTKKMDCKRDEEYRDGEERRRRRR